MALRLKNRRTPASREPGFSDKHPSKRFSVIGVLFGLPFFLAGAGFLWFGALKPILLAAESRSWPEVPCRIFSSQVISHRDSDGDTHKVVITFAYRFGARDYRGGSYNFSDFSSGGYKGKRKIVARYPVGAEATCWVDPDDPETAVLSRAVPGVVFFLIPFTSIFMVVGGAIIVGSLGLVPRRWNPRIHSRHKPVASIDAGEGELKPQIGPRGKLFGAIFIATFWNGIVGVFLWQVAKGFGRGDPPWFLVVFLIPFVLVGLGLLASVVYFTLALSNPRFRLTLAETSPRLGQRTCLQWTATGSIRRLRTLKFLLEGHEAATYQRGTDSVTDRSCFFREVLFETDQPAALPQTECDLAVPAGSMHSFDGGNNKVLWSIRVEGAIDRWPDVSDVYPLTVRPQNPAAKTPVLT